MIQIFESYTFFWSLSRRLGSPFLLYVHWPHLYLQQPLVVFGNLLKIKVHKKHFAKKQTATTSIDDSKSNSVWLEQRRGYTKELDAIVKPIAFYTNEQILLAARMSWLANSGIKNWIWVSYSYKLSHMITLKELHLSYWKLASQRIQLLSYL